MAIELNRWPYGLELQSSANGLLLRPRQKARADWAKSFRRPRPTADDLAATRQLANEFDAKEWQWWEQAKAKLRSRLAPCQSSCVG